MIPYFIISTETVLFRIRCWQLFIFRVTWTGIDNTKQIKEKFKIQLLFFTFTFVFQLSLS